MMIGPCSNSLKWFFLPPVLALAAFYGRGSDSAPAPCPPAASAEVHYAPDENLELIDVALIREAAKQIDMAAYVLTDRAVVEALHDAAGRGVKVRVWRDASMAARVGDLDVEAQLGKEAPGVEVRSSRPGGELMHLKGYCIDSRLLRTGSANFSRSGETRQDNDLVELRAPSVCDAFEAKFERAWGRP